MNYKIFFSYFLILGFFMCLVFAYMKYNDTTNQTENDKLRQQIVAVLEKEISELQSQIDELKKNIVENSQRNTSFDDKTLNDFIKNNPELLVNTLEDFFNKKNLNDQQKAISDSMPDLLKDFNSGLIKTFIGNNNAQLKIVEFYDYSCKFSAQMNEVNKKIIAQHQDIALIFIEIPMLGPDSVEATKFAIAVSMIDQPKYLQFQTALFNSSLPKNKDHLMQIATNNGIDAAKLEKFLNENLDKIEERIKKNGALFNNMKLQDAPTYIIGNEVLVGAVDLNKINNAIVKAKNEINNKQ